MSSIRYRADIDGLRALAVLSVIVFHLNSKWLPGGFLGVDIFFVISGFLITSIIYTEIKQGVFSYKNFYIRRIKRILPLFFVVVITGLLLGWYVFLPTDRYGLSNSAAAATAFLANLYFARQGGYFDIANDEKPFLHLWSLSVEEQFYFIFPTLLLGLCCFAFTRKRLKESFVVIAILLIIGSFYKTTWNGYYLFHTRAIELLVGAFLAIVTTDRQLAHAALLGMFRGYSCNFNII